MAKFHKGQLVISNFEKEPTIIKILDVGKEYYQYQLVKCAVVKPGKHYKDTIYAIDRCYDLISINYNVLWNNLNA